MATVHVLHSCTLHLHINILAIQQCLTVWVGTYLVGLNTAGALEHDSDYRFTQHGLIRTLYLKQTI